jgi:hypothetical protein
MTQEIKQLAAKDSSSEEVRTLDDAKQLLQTNTDIIRTSLHTKASTAKILAILQECPCLVKCTHEIQSTSYDDIDALYAAKHEYAKRKLIDAIVDRFADLVTVSSEHSVPSGKLDIVIMPGGKIILKYNKRIIGIELKSGKSADAKTLYQIERYLPECDILLFVRILTEEVTLINRDSVETNLIESISRSNRKISRITKGALIKVQGEWCKGCNAKCEYKQPPRWNGESKASLDNFPEFMKNIENVITKTLVILEKELDHTTDKK